MDLSATLALLFTGARCEEANPEKPHRRTTIESSRGVTVLGVQAFKAWDKARQRDSRDLEPLSFEAFVPVETATSEAKRINDALARAAVWSVRVDRRVSSADKARMRRILGALSLREPAVDTLHKNTVSRISTRELSALATNQAEACMIWLTARSILTDASITEQRFLAKLSRNLSLPDALLRELERTAISILPVFDDQPELLPKPEFANQAAATWA